MEPGEARPWTSERRPVASEARLLSAVSANADLSKITDPSECDGEDMCWIGLLGEMMVRSHLP